MERAQGRTQWRAFATRERVSLVTYSGPTHSYTVLSLRLRLFCTEYLILCETTVQQTSYQSLDLNAVLSRRFPVRTLGSLCRHRFSVFLIQLLKKCLSYLLIIAIALAVSRWLPTAAARVWSSGICGGQSGAGAGFPRALRFPLPIFIPPNSPSS
jgi:hypothetical protein